MPKEHAAQKASDTKIELLLRKAIWQKGYRYRRHYKELFGKSDIVLTKYKIAIFYPENVWQFITIE